MLQVPSTHRFSAFSTKTASSGEAKQRLQKDDEAEELFHAVKKAALSEEQRNIKILLEQGIAIISTCTAERSVLQKCPCSIMKSSLSCMILQFSVLEQAKVDGKPQETSAELNSPVETTTTTTTMTTTGEVVEKSKSSLEFKSPEERPDFLGVVKKKAERFKEILKVIKENSTLTGDEIGEDLTIEEVRELEGGFTYWC